MAQDAARSGRGRLSSLDLLPAWADEAKLWAFAEMKARKLPQMEILDAFNERLKVAAWENGITEPPVISSSAFNRAAMRLAVLGRRLEETREIANVLAPKLETAGDDGVTLLVAESIKMLLHEMLSNAGDIEADGEAAEMLMFTARALKHAEEAKRISADSRRHIEREFVAKAAKAVDAVAKAKGLSPETVESIKANILGLRDRTPPAGGAA